ncbi:MULTISPECIES: type I secretion system permease/ATPase [unclassified Mesorhizobium]|uniref:type I secretion system permease/ATPase n=1 Tax=unclassified Mesorhizobium TaxID=325217 RepID=UPI003338B36F
MALKPKSEEISRVFRACRGYFLTAALFSLAINLLYLAGPLYMLQVYDRVVSSASETTLVMLTAALLMAFVALAGLDMIRAWVLTRASVRLDRLLGGRIVAATIDVLGGAASKSQPLRDFDTFRQFVTGAGMHAIFDLPWAPIYIGIIFLLHPVLGFFALGCAVLLLLMALVNEWVVRGPLTEANDVATLNYGFTEMGLRNAEVVRAMGMTEGLLRRWSQDRFRVLDRQAVASDRAATMQSLIKFLRLSMQSVILGLGAYLVINRMATAGAMFAASILLGRALQPVEQTVGAWRGLVSARGAWLRVKSLLLATPLREQALTLPRPAGRLSVEGLTYVTPGSNRPILRGVTFQIEAGETLGVIGPSGAGKSTLARQLIGVLKPSAGVVRLDGADVSVWPRNSLGRHLGYLPQDIELFAETVAANISRFQTDMDSEVVAAAQLAGVHEMILRLPNGYDTQVGEGGAVLSGGYRQRIGLARAVFGEPSVVVLDEPASNLDVEGDSALAECIAELKRQGATVVIISHRPSTLAQVDKILLLRDGAVELFGERTEVIAKLSRPLRAVPAQAPPDTALVATVGN